MSRDWGQEQERDALGRWVGKNSDKAERGEASGRKKFEPEDEDREE
jgi:hypothetical protein